jgi:hypothetical protein
MIGAVIIPGDISKNIIESTPNLLELLLPVIFPCGKRVNVCPVGHEYS